MSERIKMKPVCLMAIVVFGIVSTTNLRAADASDRKPNIIYVMLDDAGCLYGLSVIDNTFIV